MKIQVTSAKVSIPVFKDGKYLKTVFADKNSNPIEVEDKTGKSLIAGGYAKAVDEKAKPEPVMTGKPKETRKPEVEDEKSGTLPPGAKAVSKKK